MIVTPRDVTRPASDPQAADLATPVNQSGLVKAFLNVIPAYRQGLSPARRGLEIGLFHGYWLIGPFAKLGPLRDTNIANLAGLFSTIGLVIIASLSVLLYAASNPPQPTVTLTTPKPPEDIHNPAAETRSWGNWAIGFLIGGVAGAVLAYGVLLFIV